MWTKSFWLQAAERCLKTAAQAALALMTGDGLGVLDIAWTQVASVAGLAAVASVLTSVVSAGVGETSSPSLVETEPSDRD